MNKETALILLRLYRDMATEYVITKNERGLSAIGSDVFNLVYDIHERFELTQHELVDALGVDADKVQHLADEGHPINIIDLMFLHPEIIGRHPLYRAAHPAAMKSLSKIPMRELIPTLPSELKEWLEPLT